MTLNQIKSTGTQISRLYRTLSKNSLLTIALLLPMLFAASCAESSSEKAERVGGVTAQQIVEDPGAYVGKTVTVSGDVEEIHGPRAFNMDSGASVGELLIVGREPFPQISGNENRAYVINDVATITGVVRMLDEKSLRDEIGWDLDPNLLSDYKGKPVLVVAKAEFRPGKAGAATNLDANVNKTTTNNNNTQMEAGDKGDGSNITDIGIYFKAADKSSLVNKKAQFADARVVRVVGPRTFTVASGTDEIYVMLDDESARGVGSQGKIEVGDMVNVSGTFERLQLEEIRDIKNNRFRALTDAERAFLEKTKVFLQANKVGGSK